MSELVKIRMHGIFAEKIGKEFNLAVNSVSEAFHAINVVTNDSIRRLQLENIQNDLNLSKLVASSIGAHEISFTMDLPEKKEHASKFRVVNCPQF